MGEFRLTQLQERIVPAMIELMITDSGSVILHGIHNIDNRFTLRQAADIRPGKVISGIKKPRRTIFWLFPVSPTW